MSDTNDMRREFETWCEQSYSATLLDKANLWGRLAAWAGWQAATERATAVERERCAELCETMPWVDGESIPSNFEMAAAIRQGKPFGETL